MNKSRLSSTYKLTQRLPILLVAIALPMHAALAADESVTTLSDVDVEDTLNILPNEPISSVFGFDKTAAETPRSFTTISNELMNSVNITDLDDLVAMAPGTFTQSFFGVAGSLDVRGSSGENYFRGVRRIENPGNYPTAIGASDRIDIVRGPASPIYGPSRIGGYLNFVPKSARASTGQYLTDAKGEIGITTGSWSKKVLHAEVGGPGDAFGKPFGYYLYGESENSGSYYENSSTEQSILQASFDMKLTDTLRTEFGGMYQNFKGNQVAGWNRLTQELIDNGTYITGSPSNLDTNGDGLLSHAESDAGIRTPFGNPFVFSLSNASLTSAVTGVPGLALVNPGKAHLDGSQVLVQEDDTLESKIVTLYGDLFYELDNGFKITNKMFYESLKNINENAYGFSQAADTYALEDQLIFGYGFKVGGSFAGSLQFSPSVRYQEFAHSDDFDYEYFDRRDITQPGSPIDRRTLSTRGQEVYSHDSKGSYTDSAVAFLADLTWFNKLNFVGGARYDNIKMKAKGLLDATRDTGVSASDTQGATSWSGSLSYALPFGLRPYYTRASQTGLITGQGGQLEPSDILDDSAIAESSLTEYGLKASLLGGRLYVAADHYKQKRTDKNTQDIVTSALILSEGDEIELTYVVAPQLTLTGAYTTLKVYNLTSGASGLQFSFVGGQDALNLGVNPALMYGGTVGSLFPVTNEAEGSRKAGIPETMYSLNAIINLNQWIKGFTMSVGTTHVSSVYSGYSKSVKLPAYTLVNAGLHYESDHWTVGLQGKNITDERYFRSNFPDLFGSSVVLPELPRNYVLNLGYKF